MVLGLAAASVLALGGTIVPAQAALAPGWHLTKVIGTGQDTFDPIGPGGLAAPSRANAWMTWADCFPPCSGNPTSTLSHWNGHRWVAVPPAELQGLSPQNVAASSATDTWAFGPVPDSVYYGARHWNGIRWRKVATPTWMIRGNGSGGIVVYAADFSPQNLWVFSLYGRTGQKTAFAARYHNGRWARSYFPDIPEQAAALSSTDIWVLGQAFSGTGPVVALRWNGRRWLKSAFPRQREAGNPYGLVAAGRRSLWLVWAPVKTSERQYLLHWTGRGWARLGLPAKDDVLALTGDGGSGVWATAVAPGKARPQLLMHWSAGHWKVTKLPLQSVGQVGQMDEISVIGGTRSVWGAGYVYSAGSNPLNRVAIWRYNP